MGVKVHLETEGEAGKGSQLQLPESGGREQAEPWSLRVRDLCLGGAGWSSGDGKAMLRSPKGSGVCHGRLGGTQPF